jgi:hypothetical protein
VLFDVLEAFKDAKALQDATALALSEAQGSLAAGGRRGRRLARDRATADRVLAVEELALPAGEEEGAVGALVELDLRDVLDVEEHVEVEEARDRPDLAADLRVDAEDDLVEAV